MKNRKQYLTGTIVAVGMMTAFNCNAALAQEPALEPEIVSSTWEEGELECAAVTINGDEIIAYKGSTQNGTAEAKAEALVEKLEELIEDDSDSIEGLLPAREGCFAAIKGDGKTIIKFEPTQPLQEGDEGAAQAIKTSLHVINALRTATGHAKLSEALVKMAEASATGRLANFEGADDSFSGRASWYGPKFHGRKTSNGERFDQEGMTAAHRTLPFGTKLLVTNRSTGKSCVVKVNDRGPYKDNRVIDLSKGAAREINMVSSGVAMVDVVVLQ